MSFVFRFSRLCLQVHLADRFFSGQAAVAEEVTERIRELHASGIPVLVLTRTPQGAVAWAESLKKAGIEAERLVGIQSGEEAADVCGIGRSGKGNGRTPLCCAQHDGRISVSEIGKTGGLRIIIVQLPASPCHQQCILERCVPRGVPGSVQRMLSLEDDLMAAYIPRWWRRPARPFHGLMLRICQWRAGRDYAHAREELFRMEDYLGDVLAFSGGQL